MDGVPNRLKLELCLPVSDFYLFKQKKFFFFIKILLYAKLFLFLAPSKGVTNVRVVPITTTSVRVHWTPVDEIYWSGDQGTGGYRVIYQPESDFLTALKATPKEDILGIKVNAEMKNFPCYLGSKKLFLFS